MAAAGTLNPSQTRNASAPRRIFGLAPYLLGVYFTVWSLWGIGATGIVDTDAARHAMNGVFIHDLARSGSLWHPIQYAEQYYGHLPALSMPYHPPMFPAIEALLFAIFGVKLFTARLAVAAAVGASAILLYRLTEATLGSRIVAACVTVTALSLESSQLVGQDVMLEFPAMAFMLAALYCLRDLENVSMWRAVWFAVFASIAFWTKQHSVLLGGVLVLAAIFSGRWRMIFRKPMLAALGIFGASVIAYAYLSSRFHNAGIHSAANSTTDLGWIARATIPAYFEWIKADFTGLPWALGVCAIAVSLFAWRRKGMDYRLGLYWAWIVSTALVLTDLGDTNNRYLFFVFPATITLGYAWLYRGCARLWGKPAAALVASAFALAWLATGWFHQREFLRGPGEAASAVARDGPSHVLYAGEADGQFIFEVRVLDPKLQVTVIPGGKVPYEAFEPGNFEDFCNTYAIDWVVVENVPIHHSWTAIEENHPAFLRLQKTIPLQSTRVRWRTGSIDVYKVMRGSQTPGGILKLPVPKLGGSIDVKL